MIPGSPTKVLCFGMKSRGRSSGFLYSSPVPPVTESVTHTLFSTSHRGRSGSNYDVRGVGGPGDVSVRRTGTMRRPRGPGWSGVFGERGYDPKTKRVVVGGIRILTNGPGTGTREGTVVQSHPSRAGA